MLYKGSVSPSRATNAPGCSFAASASTFHVVSLFINYANKSLAHMVMSLKPFGCMPSAQSDGAQAAVTSHFPDMIYIPIETSGEGDVNAHSRAQMALGEAKLKCKQEFQQCTKRCGYTLDQIRAYRTAWGVFRDRRPEMYGPLLTLDGKTPQE